MVELEPATLAVTGASGQQEEISSRIQGLFDVVNAWLPYSGVERWEKRCKLRSVHIRFPEDIGGLSRV